MNLNATTRSLLALAALCGSAAAPAAVCTSGVPAPCVNTFQIYGKPNGIELVSELVWTGPIVKIHNIAKLNAVDSYVQVRWTAADGSVLVHGENVFGFFNGWYSWESEWTGVWFPHPHVVLDTGTADFTGSSPMPTGCSSAPCDARYYDWDPNARRAGSHPSPATPPPGGGVVATAGALQSVQPSETDPDDLTLATFVDLFRYASRVEAVGSEWRYDYSFQNLSAAPVDFALAVLAVLSQRTNLAARPQSDGWVS